MKKITSDELRAMYLKFFEDKGHHVIASSSLIPENDPTVLFTTAGMHPLVPYLMGEKHPAGTRLTDVQKCVRTGDIDEVGDSSHCTFFEMLGNWSLGDYFKKDAIAWSYEFLTSPNYLGIDKDRLAVSVFEGDGEVPRDTESAELWEKLGIAKERIFFLPRKNNWWGPAGVTGPCGPDTEMFIDTGKPKCGPHCDPSCDCGKYLEIWNDVFMQYHKMQDGSYQPLKQKNVDTGMGLERTVCVLNGVKSVYETDLFQKAIETLETLTGRKYIESEEVTHAFRIVLDHTRTATFILGDQKGVTPSNVDQGYVLRRLIRRAVRFGRNIGLPQGSLSKIAEVYIENYRKVYGELEKNRTKIVDELNKEEEKFSKTLQQGIREFVKMSARLHGDKIEGTDAFRLYDTFGFPVEMTVELAKEKGLKVDVEAFDKAFSEHQKKSHAGAEQKFKGGLQDSSVQTARLHTATHLLHAALQKVLKCEAMQKGSNITAERLRFDFGFDRKMEDGEIAEVERIVNEAIQADVPIECSEMTVKDAKERGAIGVFDSKYGEKVKVYKMGDYSMEICGGPHAARTGELGKFKIVKEQSSSSGVRRIKAVLE